MNRRVLFAVCVAGSLLLAACRQPDGPLPAETVEDPNRLYDVSRDLLNISGGDPNGTAEFVNDVMVWGGDASVEPTKELGRRFTVALKGTRLSEPSAAQLARHVWITAAGRELSSRQVERLREDVRTLLISAGATEDAAKSAADQVGEVQAAVTLKRRRWFQLF